MNAHPVLPLSTSSVCSASSHKYFSQYLITHISTKIITQKSIFKLNLDRVYRYDLIYMDENKLTQSNIFSQNIAHVTFFKIITMPCIIYKCMVYTQVIYTQSDGNMQPRLNTSSTTGTRKWCLIPLPEDLVIESVTVVLVQNTRQWSVTWLWCFLAQDRLVMVSEGMSLHCSLIILMFGPRPHNVLAACIQCLNDAIVHI